MCKQKASETRNLILIQIKMKPGPMLKFKYFIKAISFLQLRVIIPTVDKELLLNIRSTCRMRRDCV